MDRAASEHEVEAGSPVELHADQVGVGSPVVLLHGWGSTSHMWRHVVRRLSKRYELIVPDLRGIGRSPVAADGYDKVTLAGDVARLLSDQGVDSYAVVGHDWGGSVAYALAALHRRSVSHLVAIEAVLPGLAYQMDVRSPEPLWHPAFHAAEGLAETIVAGREREYLAWFYRRFSHRPEAIRKHDLDTYAAAYSRPGAFGASMAWYRTREKDSADIRKLARTPLACPVLALGGDSCLGLSPLNCFRVVADDVTGSLVEDCGHWVPEEQPKATAEHIVAFLAS